MRCRVCRCGRPALRLGLQHVYSWFLLRQYGIYMPNCGTLFPPSNLGESPWDAELRQIMDWTCHSQVHASSTLRLTVELLQGPRRVRARAPPSSLTSDRGRPRAVWDGDDFASLVGGRRCATAR
jgi:hypothetical protein